MSPKSHGSHPSHSSRGSRSPVRLLLGDCLRVLPTLAPDSIDSIVTDPPWGISFMGKSWDAGQPLTAIWEELLRVAKPGGILVATVPGRETEGEVTHLTFEEESTWQEWLTGAGLDVAAPALSEIRARLLAHARWHGCNTLLLAQRPTSPWASLPQVPQVSPVPQVPLPSESPS